jgi:16S rRNA (cytosine1402-N4)-methyltransferase
MATEVCEALAPAPAKVFVDGTFGGGGYARALLDAADCSVWGIDRDPAAIDRGAALKRHYGSRLGLISGRFSDLVGLLASHGVRSVDGVAFDLGVSSPQLDDPERGFSFQVDGPLDMRMGGDGPTAADAVNRLPEAELADIIHRFGEERAARRIARAIVAARGVEPITRTLQLAGIVSDVVRRSGRGREAIHPATRTFQAIRIHINRELGPGGELERGLNAAERILAPGGRLAVVSFHSLEDREVKRFLTVRSGAGARPNRHRPESSHGRAPTFATVGRGVQRPSAAEVAVNPRARSARLRAATRTAASPWPEGIPC